MPRRRPVPQYPDLATYFRLSDDTQANAANVVGTTQAHISRIAAGQMVPRPELAERLAAYARIPLESFTRMHLAWRRKREVA
jgi:transcriptional regulator with XRE-family HTH domain